ncbi:MAG: hypothetical protein HYR94_12500, partial [Chloroflexi bacterium]|nr:hypothetical protein [Chloroflexota bacterium]
IFFFFLRLLMRWTGLELDEQAVYALFQYGTIPPPLTICQRIRRIPNGHVLKITPPSTEPAFEVFFQPGKDLPLDRNSADPERQVQQTLDDILADIPASTALYFSGGVDSGLIAARLADLGRTDVRLINYAFGPQDPEGHLALQMAAYLGLTCEQIMYKPSDIFLMLQRIGQDYSFPFGDRSVIPTNLLVHASLRSIDPLSAVIEGTGGDGAFGPWALRSRVASLPGWVRWLMATGYKGLKGWRYNSKIEHVGRLARKNMSMPLPHVIAIAYNPLNGIAYTIPDRVSKALEQVIKTRVEILSVGLEPEAQLSLLDLVCVCAGRFAAKSFDPLRAYGVKAIYPFLEPAMLRLSSSLPYDQKCNGGQAKALLKSLLARQVPGELIYRPKSGFTSPFQEILTHDSMREFVRSVVLARDNPLLDFCQIDVVKQMIRRAEQGQTLNVEAHKFLWGLIFTSGWLRQLELQE